MNTHARFASELQQGPSEEVQVNWNKWIRQTHRWLSIAFTLTVAANFAAMTRGQPPAWITYSPLFPLALLFFSGLFVAYIVYRAIHPEIFEWGHVYLNKWLGGLNTAVLIFSSLTMAWAVRAAQKGQKNLLVALLSITFLCAGAFLVVKYFEYSHKFHVGELPGKWFRAEELMKYPGANLYFSSTM